jgi:hypothetical protein
MRHKLSGLSLKPRHRKQDQGLDISVKFMNFPSAAFAPLVKPVLDSGY